MVCAVVLAAGCTDGDSDAACHLSTEASGDASWDFSGEPACAIPFGPSVGMLMGFLPLEGDLKSLSVRVDLVHEGETGTFPATVTATTRDDRMFATPKTCMVTFTEHAATGESDQFAREFQVAGTGSCADAAVAGSSRVVIAPFSYRFPARW
jgi:hypothetical protein